MAIPKIDPEIRAEVIAALAKGIPPGEIARTMGDVVSLRTITRIAKEQRASINERAKRLAEQAAPDAPAEDDADDVTPTPEKLRKMIARLWRKSDAAERAGNTTLSTQLARSATDAMNTLLRAEQGALDDADVVRISLADIEKRKARVLKLFAAIAERPLLCEKCSRELSVEYGTGKPPAASA